MFTKMKLFKFDITDSTNERAREYASRGADALPAVFIANGQSKGRGRRGRRFDSSVGKGLYMTVLFDPWDAGIESSMITVRAAVAVARAIDAFAGISVGIKWVNDIFVGDRKLAGILAEGVRDGASGRELAALGIGVNLLHREFPPEICDIATSVEDVCGRLLSADTLAARILEEFFSDTYERHILDEYRSRSVVIGKNVEVRRILGESFTAKVLDITDSGALLVSRNGAETEELISAEVSIKKI